MTKTTFIRTTTKSQVLPDGSKVLLIQISPRKFMVKKEGKPIREYDKVEEKDIQFVEILRYKSDLSRADAETFYSQLTT